MSRQTSRRLALARPASFSELTFTNDAGTRIDRLGAIFSWLHAVSNSLLRLTPTTSVIAESVRLAEHR
jgi:hypothetical protein